MQRLPHLRLICQTGRGMPHVDVDACTRRGIVVCNGGGSPYAPAELTLALMLGSARCLVADAVALRAGTWQTTVGRELHGRVLGIAGYGAIGALVAGYGRALGMERARLGPRGIAGACRRGRRTRPSPTSTRSARAPTCSACTSSCRRRRAGSWTRRRLALMKPDALLVNTARAGLIEPGALAAALDAGRPGSAAVDVFDEEPALDDPLVAHTGVLATPHLGYVTWETYESYFGQAFAQVNAFAAGAPTGVVNPEALERAGGSPGADA